MPRAHLKFGKGVRAIWQMMGATLVLLIGAELVSSIALRGHDFGRPSHDPRIDADAYRGARWTADYYEEAAKLRANWRPYTYWRMREFDGRFIDVDHNGLRQTIQTDLNATSGDQPRIFMFGGSTMWGTGARDRYTIPSHVAAALGQKGVAAEVVNYGEIGYVSTQEVLALMLELRAGNIPDLVVFYDGINDVWSSFQSGFAGVPHNEYRRRAEFNLLSRYRSTDLTRAFVYSWLERSATIRVTRGIVRRLKKPAPIAPGPSEMAAARDLPQEVAQSYTRNIEMVRTLGEQYGFKTLFYWQPVIYTKPILTNYESVQLGAAKAAREFFEQSYEAVVESCDRVVGFRDISHILADHQEPCFLDFMHLSEDANAVVAMEMAGDISLLLRQNRVMQSSPELR